MSYAIRKDGHGWRAVDGPDDVDPDETFSDDTPPQVQSAPDNLPPLLAARAQEQLVGLHKSIDAANFTPEQAEVLKQILATKGQS